ncbi:hypothetical protein V1511DRAFT_508515 [Dipodascopsis uninucleata]
MTLQISLEPPVLEDSPSLTSFGLLDIFRPFGALFFLLWNLSMTQPGPTSLDQPAATSASAMADIENQQWLCIMVWSLSTTLGYLSNTAAEESLTFSYPLQIARDLCISIWKVPLWSMNVHEAGLTEKIDDIACTVIDVMSCLSTDGWTSGGMELGPIDYLNCMFRTIADLVGGKDRFLPLLFSIVSQNIPSLTTSISRHLTLPLSSDVLSEEALESERLNNFDSTFHDVEMSLWLNYGKIFADMYVPECESSKPLKRMTIPIDDVPSAHWHTQLHIRILQIYHWKQLY